MSEPMSSSDHWPRKVVDFECDECKRLQAENRQLKDLLLEVRDYKNNINLPIMLAARIDVAIAAMKEVRDE